MTAQKGDIADRFLGATLGLAAGNALRTTLEFKLHADYQPLGGSTTVGDDRRDRADRSLRKTHVIMSTPWSSRSGRVRAATLSKTALAAVNLGEDPDTTGAVYEQPTGAFSGKAAIPDHLRRRIAHADVIAQLARRLARAEA